MPNKIKTLAALTLFCLTTLVSANARATLPAKDPLNSPMWQSMVKQYFPSGDVVFDDRVKVLAAPQAEDSMNFPVMVDATAIADVVEILVFADLNPIATVLRFYPHSMAAKIGFRIKLQQGTPVRAAVKDAVGNWHVGGHYVDAAGGGCTAPSVGSASADWSSRLGEMSGRLFGGEEKSRLRFRVMHPMDTGLAAGIPAFFIEQLYVADASGKEVGVIMPYEPVSENPVFTVEVPGSGSVSISGRDNNGNLFDAEMQP